MNIDSNGVHEIVAEIWESMLGLQIEPVSEPAQPSGREISASVQITGGWQGAFIVECPAQSAAAFTAAMLGMDDGEEPSEGDIHDVIGELANMAGGNLKAVVGEESRLSLPTVATGSNLDINVVGATEVVRSEYRAGGAVFTVAVVARSQ